MVTSCLQSQDWIENLLAVAAHSCRPGNSDDLSVQIGALSYMSFFFHSFCMITKNCLYVWVRDHRQHHKYSDTDADPHNANRGFFFSHVGWLMSRKHPKVKEYGKKIDMSDLEADKYIMFQKE